MTVTAARGAAAARVGEPRHRARELAVQMLYQQEIGGLTGAAMAEMFWAQVPDAAAGLSPKARAFATELAAGAAAHAAEIDPLITDAATNWRLERLHVLDRIVLRLAVYELLHQPGTPARVVLNEALELARTFSSEESVRFVNGVLDSIQHRLERT